MGYTGDLRRNTTGGLAVGTAYSDVFDLGVSWRTSAFGAGITTNLAVMYTGGDGISAELVGDLQGLNGIEAAPGWKLYESWVELGFGERFGSRPPSNEGTFRNDAAHGVRCPIAMRECDTPHQWR